MDKISAFAQFIVNQYDYNSFAINRLDVMNMHNNQSYIYKVQYFLNLNKHSDYHMKLESIATKVDLYVVEISKKFKSIVVTDYIVCALEPDDSIRCYNASNILSDIDVLLLAFEDLKVRLHVGSAIEDLGYRPSVNYQVNGVHHTEEYGFHFKHSVLLNNKREHFGPDITSYLELETIVLKDAHVSEQLYDDMPSAYRIIINMYSDSVLLCSKQSDFDYEDFKNNYNDIFKLSYFDLFKPFTTDLSEYSPLDFKKELTTAYIDNFKKHIADIQTMRDY